jgi:mRNA interferase MazF
MVAKSYIPDRGDVVWISLNPSKGREQTGRRPAIVISPKLYNLKSRLILLCPITSKKKGYPFETEISIKEIEGVVLADQIKSLDWKVRNIKFITKVSPDTIRKIFMKVRVLVS